MFLENLFKDNTVFCPLCNHSFSESGYLKDAIDDEKARWLANTVMHYRHNHITSWNKCWGYTGGHYRSGWFGDYELEKRKVNERAKRQIIRKATEYLKYHKITVDHFKMLENNDNQILALAEKKL